MAAQSTSAASTAPVLQSSGDAFKPPAPVTYTEKYEAGVGLGFMNGQAGQNLPKRYNMGGAIGTFAWYVRPKWGVMADGGWMAGTTPVFPAAQTFHVQTRPLVTQTFGMGGVTYRGFGNQLAGFTLHALAGVTYGDFTHSTNGQASVNAAGLYNNGTAPMAIAGGTLDFNRSAKWVVRVQPDMVFEHFGTETREYVRVTVGLVRRFGNR